MNSLSFLHNFRKKNQVNWDLSEIMRPFRERIFKKGEAIYEFGQTENEIFFIVKGKVLVYHWMDKIDKEAAFGLYSNGEFLNATISIEQPKVRRKAIAKSDTTVKLIPLLAFHKLMEENVVLQRIVFQNVCDNQLQLFEKLQQLEWQNTRQRILYFLLDYVQKFGRDVGYEKVVRNFLTHLELGHLCNASRQSVTTVLNDLRYNKIIHFNRRYLLVRDIKRLQDLAIAS